MEAERHVFTTEKASVIREAMSLVLSEARFADNVAPGTAASLEACAKNGCQRMILDLRAPGEPPFGMASRIRNLRASHIGQVLVVSGEVTDPRLLHQLEALRHPQSFPVHLASSLVALAHMFFCAIRR